jgi:uncharacterized membrane-anchored protein
MLKLTFLPRILCALALAAFLAGYNISVAGKESLLAHGSVMLLELAPVDPLSLLQGYYMELNYKAEREIARKLNYEYDDDDEFDADDLRGSGRAGPRAKAPNLAVMRDSGGGIYAFSRIYAQGESLAPDEHLLAFKIVRGGFNNVRISGGSYFFEEGYAGLYNAARYAEFRVAGDGSALLARLRDAEGRVIDKSLLEQEQSERGQDD